MKRVRKYKDNPNPLFEKWLEEFRQEQLTRDPDSPVHFSYTKALTSLRKCPVTLPNGKACRALKNFGEKICTMLDKRLERYNAEHGIVVQQEDADVLPDAGEARRAPKRAKKAYVPRIRSGAYAILIALHLESQEPDYPGFMYREDLQSKARAFCDNPMNGTATQHYGSWNSMGTLNRKNLVIRQSNPAKYSLTDAGAELALALYEQRAFGDSSNDDDPGPSNPRNVKKSRKGTATATEAHGIADDGPSLDDMLNNINNVEKNSDLFNTEKLKNSLDLNLPSTSKFESESRDDGLTDEERRLIAESERKEEERRRVALRRNQPSPIGDDILRQIAELDRLDKEKKRLIVDNVVRQSEEMDESNLNRDQSSSMEDINRQIAELEKSDREKKNFDTTGDWSPPREPTTSSALKSQNNVSKSTTKHARDLVTQNERDVEVISVPDSDDEVFEYNASQKSNTAKVHSESYHNSLEDDSHDSEDFDEYCKENAEPIVTVRKPPLDFLFTESLDVPSSSNDFDQESYETDSQATANREFSVAKEKTNEVNPQKDEVTKVRASPKKKAPVESTPTEIFTLLPNNFDIILLVDTGETKGKARPKDDATKLELSRMKVLFEVRKLNIGDFAWIARCRITNRELVLPYIIERKRMDDLSSSIMDGRYREQKFRLGQSGIKNVIYLVESYGKTHHGAIPLASCLQAAVNSLIQDNFSVKHTRDHRDSMHYLATLTTLLTEMYEGKELNSCPKKDLESIDPNTSEESERLMEFTDFHKSAVKTKNFKVREMLIRQLLQLKGVSVEKALGIAEQYPTPKLLAAALNDADDTLLANVTTTGSTKRKIGPAISKTLHQFYTSRSLC